MTLTGYRWKICLAEFVATDTAATNALATATPSLIDNYG